MTAASKDVKTDQYGTPDAVWPELYNFPVAAATTIYAGTMVATDASGNAVPASATASLRIWGRCERQVVNTVAAGYGSAGDLRVEVHPGLFYFTNDTTNAVTNAYRGQYVYALDDQTVGTSDLGGTLPLAGWVYDVPASGQPEYGKVAVMVGMASPYNVNPLLGDDAAAAYKARNVATNLAALTFTSGTFLANANGALGAQDGVTNAVGDVIMIPEGTITTGVVSAANSGPWVLTAIGGASAKFSGIRPDWWPHGGTTVLGSAVSVGGEGTLFGGTRWPSFAAAITIGTGDPVLRPDKVTQQVTLSSGTRTISNVPVLSTSRTGVLCTMITGGTPAGTTTSYQAKSSAAGIVAGGIGTASVIVEAQSVAGTIVNTDVAKLNVTITNG